MRSSNAVPSSRLTGRGDGGNNWCGQIDSSGGAGDRDQVDSGRPTRSGGVCTIPDSHGPRYDGADDRVARVLHDSACGVTPLADDDIDDVGLLRPRSLPETAHFRNAVPPVGRYNFNPPKPNPPAVQSNGRTVPLGTDGGAVARFARGCCVEIIAHVMCGCYK